MSKLLQEFTAIDKYCRWIPEKNRRESWNEAVDRYFNYLIKRLDLKDRLNNEDWMELHKAKDLMKEYQVFGSMRALMTAGPALDKDDVAAYNCCYIAINNTQDFGNILYTLACGTGVGFSVERDNINNLPIVAETITKVDEKLVVPDSREGWADAYVSFINGLYNGKHYEVDFSEIRPAGARLKTFGGRASGPEPYIKLIKFTAKVFHNAKGRKLKSLEVHDLVCQVAESIISGGVRRSALISLSDLSDNEMAHAKSGPWWETNGRRSLANNSAVYETKPDMGMFLHEWSALYNSRSGERGVCNREAMRKFAERAGRDTNYAFGTNPCSEIILRPDQFCNLSTIAVRPDDQAPQLIDKIRYATILGTLQSALTDFKYFASRRQINFKKNCEEERLLGVSMTGIFDNNLTNGGHGPQELQKLLEALHYVAHATNTKWATVLNIPISKSITCIKPEGTTSCVAGTASGLHPRHSKFYIRRSQMPVGSPMTQFLKDAGVPWQPFFYSPETMVVFEFPVKADFGVTDNEVNPIGHLNLWLSYQLWYCDHKPSVTVNYTDKDFLAVGSWLWTYWHYVSGVSFLPKDDNTYEHTPFETITEEQYNELNAKMPESIDWSLLSKYEQEDTTKSSHAMVCTAAGCELT